jgi:drug/metabolite transporter (DMT)-like permease
MSVTGSGNRGKLILAFLAVYLVWGSTYLAIRFGVESWPPFMMSGLRFMVAGLLLLAWSKYRGEPLPKAGEWLNSLLVGALLITVGNGIVSCAERSVASAVAALGVAVVPLFTLVFSQIWGHRNTRLEWLGILLGLGGILLLNLGHNLRADPLGGALLLLAACGWAFGSVWSKHLQLPKGTMGMAAQMFMGGAASMTVSVVLGERLEAMPTLKSWLAILYLTTFGSLVAFSAYLYLWHRVRPAAATSYAYVNPAVAMVLGIWLANERMGLNEWLALAVIVGAVVLIGFPRREIAI